MFSWLPPFQMNDLIEFKIIVITTSGTENSTLIARP